MKISTEGGEAFVLRESIISRKALRWNHASCGEHLSGQCSCSIVSKKPEKRGLVFHPDDDAAQGF